MPLYPDNTISHREMIKSHVKQITPRKSYLSIDRNASQALVNIFEDNTWWKSEIAVAIDGKRRWNQINATNIKQISTWDANNVEVDLGEIATNENDVHILSHNHPDNHGDSNVDDWALWLSDPDILANKKLEKMISKPWYHVLQKTYTYNWKRISSFIVCQLDNDDNKSWSTFDVDGKTFSQLFMIDWKLVDINDFDMPTDLAITVLKERFWLIGEETDFPSDNYDDQYQLAA